MREGVEFILITREMDYAIRIVRTLYRDGQQAASEIAEKEGIPMSFAYKILKKLGKAEIVQSLRGANGGYQLLRACDQMTLLDIVTALNEEVLLTECLASGYACSSGKSGGCSIHKEFCRIQELLERELTNKRMSELLQQ